MFVPNKSLIQSLCLCLQHFFSEISFSFIQLYLIMPFFKISNQNPPSLIFVSLLPHFLIYLVNPYLQLINDYLVKYFVILIDLLFKSVFIIRSLFIRFLLIYLIKINLSYCYIRAVDRLNQSSLQSFFFLYLNRNFLNCYHLYLIGNFPFFYN